MKSTLLVALKFLDVLTHADLVTYDELAKQSGAYMPLLNEIKVRHSLIEYAYKKEYERLTN